MKATKARIIVKVFGCSDALWGPPTGVCSFVRLAVEQSENMKEGWSNSSPFKTVSMFMVICPGSRVSESRVHIIFLLIIYFML